MAKARKGAALAAQEESKQEVVLTTFKGFDANWQCRGFQYAVGQTYEHQGGVEACASGFHACEYPLHVLRYYKPGSSRFAVVEQSGELSRHEEDSKVASSRLTVRAEIDLGGLIKAAIKYTLDRCKPADGAVSATPNTVVKADGRNESATASGDSGAATASGNYGAATASGDSGAATASGYSGAATASGCSGAATASGDSGAATASGYYGAATASGNSGAATASGYSGAAIASGDYGAATASGDSGAATASGKKSTACAPGRNGKAKAAKGCALFLTYRDDDWNIVHAWAGIAGRDGIKPDVFYSLDRSGKPVEA